MKHIKKLKIDPIRTKLKKKLLCFTCSTFARSPFCLSYLFTSINIQDQKMKAYNAKMYDAVLVLTVVFPLS